MATKTLLLISVMFLVLSCTNKPLSKAVQSNAIKDTIIRADSLKVTNACSAKITDTIAKTALTDYFSPKNIIRKKR